MALTSLMSAARQINTRAVMTYRRRAVFSTAANQDKLFTKKHEWISVNDNIGTVGISSYAQEALGEVVYAQLPEIGKELSAGDECGALESVKAASELYTPVSGIVTEKNVAAEASPSLINEACFGEGWLFRVRLTRPEELRDLMSKEAYNEYLQNEVECDSHGTYLENK